jgi:hypothetical protein
MLDLIHGRWLCTCERRSSRRPQTDPNDLVRPILVCSSIAFPMQLRL